jgi:hypothetical protein
MAQEQAVRDGSQVTTLLVANASSVTDSLLVYGNPSTHALLVSVAGSETGALTYVAGIYNTSAPTLTNGQQSELQLDARGDLQTNAATLIAGEDQSNNVMRVEGQFSGRQCTADTQVLAAPGFVHTITIQSTDAVPTAGTIVFYDNPAESGTEVCRFDVKATADIGIQSAQTITLDRILTAGLYAGFTTVADVAVQVTYR